MKTLLNNQAVVAHPETEEVITMFSKVNSAGEEKIYGRVRVDDTELMIINGFVTPQKRTAFVTLDENALKILSPYIKQGQPYPMEGKIVVKESLEPQYDGHVPKLNPATEEYIKIDGQLVYRTTEFTTDLDAKDVKVQSISSNGLEKIQEHIIEDELVM